MGRLSDRLSAYRSLGSSRPTIELFVRHCNPTKSAAQRQRFDAFSKERCFENLVGTLDREQVNVTLMLDTYQPATEPHFITLQEVFPVVELFEGSEAGSFLRLLDHLEERQFPDETILYFLDDDYLHRPGWIDVLLEGFSLPGVDYVTLYDRRDHYLHPAEPSSRLFHTKSCHWRTTPSTAGSYAVRAGTLRRHLDLHRQFSLERTHTDHSAKFTELAREGALLVSSIPGWSTHAEPEYASPCIDWSALLQELAR